MSFNATTFEARLRKVDATQTSIQSISKYWVLTSAGSDGAPLAGIVKSQAGVFDSVSVRATVEKRLALVFLASDVLHAARRGGPALHAAFCAALLPPLVRALAIAASSTGDAAAAAVAKLTKLVALWRDRQIFPARDVATLAAALDSPATVIAEQDDADVLLRVCASGGEGPSTAPCGDAAGGAAAGAAVPEGSQEPITLRSKSPLSTLEMELTTGPAVVDISALAKSTASGASTDEAFAATEAALAAVERTEIAVRLAMDSATGVKGFADRAIVIDAHVALEARTEAFKRSLPFPALADARRSAGRLCDALGAEKRAREDAVTALSNLLVREEELACTDEAALTLAEAQLEALRSVRRRLAGRRAESAAAARAAAAAAAKAAEPEDGETADLRAPVPAQPASASRIGGLLGRAPLHPSPPSASSATVLPGASLSASDLVAQVLSSAVQSAGGRGGGAGGGSAAAVSSLHSALGVIAPDSYGAVFTPGLAPGFAALAPPNVFLGPDGESRSRLGGPTQWRPRVLPPGPGTGPYVPPALPPGYAGGGGILPPPYSPNQAGVGSAWPLQHALPPVNPGAGRGVAMTTPAWMKKN